MRTLGWARAVLLLLLAGAAVPPQAPAQGAPPEVAELRSALEAAARALTPDDGYRLRGKLIYRGAGDETAYAADFARRRSAWVVRLEGNDSTRSLSFGFDGTRAWAASPEATAVVAPPDLPACARFDYPQFVGALLGILRRGPADPQYLESRSDNDLYIRGTLPDGLVATYLFEGTAPFPRKVSLREGTPPIRLWSFVAVEGGRPQLFEYPSAAQGHVEFLFSDPESVGPVVFPQRTDLADASGVAATFQLDSWQPLERDELLPAAAPAPLWESSWKPAPPPGPDRPSFLLPESDRAALLGRLETEPWRQWSAYNSRIALIGSLVWWLPRVFPDAPGPKALGTTALLAFFGALFLLHRRRQRYGTRMGPTALVVGAVLAALFVGGSVSHQLNLPRVRSRMALQSAIRYAITGSGFHARAAAHYLRGIQTERFGGGEAGRACADYAAAYELCRGGLDLNSRAEIELGLLEVARPLYGHLQGWRARSLDAPSISIGLGLAGLATGCEPCVSAARSALDRSLEELFRDGIHRAGPGPGAAVLARAADLAHAMKNSGRHDYYTDPLFAAPASTVLSLLSPAGTLPFLGATNLTHSLDATALAWKVSARTPSLKSGAAGRAARFWNYGQRTIPAWSGWWRRLWRPAAAFFDDPLVLFQYVGGDTVESDEGNSVVVRDRIAVLRSGSTPEDLYLAIGVLAPDPERPVRDALGFDLAGRGAMLLQGAGYPGAFSGSWPAAESTRGRNTLVIGDRDQGAARSSGITAALLNQPLFDFVQADADRSYENAQVRRDIVLVRPKEGQGGYFVLVDSVRPAQQDETVSWQLFGHGSLSLGFAQNHQWNARSFTPASGKVQLWAFLPGSPGQPRSTTGRLFPSDAGETVATAGLQLDCTGTYRILALLVPRGKDDPEPWIEPAGNGAAARLQRSDWFALGSSAALESAGPLKHRSEYVLARPRGDHFPALLLRSGTEFRMGPHVLSATHPVTVSTDGLRGSILTVMPGTTVEIRSPLLPAPLILNLEEPDLHPLLLAKQP